MNTSSDWQVHEIALYPLQRAFSNRGGVVV